MPVLLPEQEAPASDRRHDPSAGRHGRPLGLPPSGVDPWDRGASSRLLYLLLPLAVFLGLHMGLRLWASPSLHFDDADLAIFDQSLELGYSEQPPLYSWLLRPVTLACGLNLFALTLFRTLLLAGFVYFLYLGSFRVLGDFWLSVLSAYSLLLIPMLAWHSLTYLTHSLLLSLACAATFYCLVRVVQTGRRLDYVAAGAVAGLGMISKYNYIFFFAALVTAGLTVTTVRRRLLRPQALLAAAAGLLVVLPHTLWLAEQLRAMRTIYRDKATAAEVIPPLLGVVPYGAVELAQNIVLLALPLTLIFLIGSPRAFFRRRAPVDRLTPYVQWLGRYFVALAAYHAAYVVATGATRLHERWLEPFLLLLPVYLFARMAQTEFPAARPRRYAYIVLVAALALTAARCGQLWLGNAHRGYNPIDSSFAEAAGELRGKITPGTVLVSWDRGVGGNLHVHLGGVPCVSLDHFGYQPPGVTDAKRYLLIWGSRGHEEMPPRMAEFLDSVGIDPAAGEDGDLYLPPVVQGRQKMRLRYRVVAAGGGEG